MDIEVEVEKCFMCPASGDECGLLSIFANNGRIANQMLSLRIQFPNYLDFTVCSQCARQLAKLEQLQRNLEERREFIQCVVDKNISFLQKRGWQEENLHQNQPEETYEEAPVCSEKESLAHYAVVKMEPTERSFADRANFSAYQSHEEISSNLAVSCEPIVHEMISPEQLRAAPRNKLVFKKGNCDVCQKYFKNANELRVHYNAVHLKIRKFKCKLCGYTFSKNFNLLRHIRSVHTDERPHTCQVCGISFKLESQLKMHTKSHAESEDFIKLEISKPSESAKPLEPSTEP